MVFCVGKKRVVIIVGWIRSDGLCRPICVLLYTTFSFSSFYFRSRPILFLKGARKIRPRVLTKARKYLWHRHSSFVCICLCSVIWWRHGDKKNQQKIDSFDSTRADVVVWFVRPQICTKKKDCWYYSPFSTRILVFLLFYLLSSSSSSDSSSLFFPSLRCSCRLLFSILVSGNLAFVALDPWRRCLLLFSSYHHRGWCNFYLLNEFDTRNVKVVKGEWMALLFFRSLSLSLSLLLFNLVYWGAAGLVSRENRRRREKRRKGSKRNE